MESAQWLEGVFQYAHICEELGWASFWETESILSLYWLQRYGALVQGQPM